MAKKKSNTSTFDQWMSDNKSSSSSQQSTQKTPTAKLDSWYSANSPSANAQREQQSAYQEYLRRLREQQARQQQSEPAFRRSIGTTYQDVTQNFPAAIQRQMSVAELHKNMATAKLQDQQAYNGYGPGAASKQYQGYGPKTDPERAKLVEDVTGYTEQYDAARRKLWGVQQAQQEADAREQATRYSEKNRGLDNVVRTGAPSLAVKPAAGSSPAASAARGSADPRNPFSRMTEEQKQIYTYLSNTQGEQAAEDYAQYVSYDVNAQQRAAEAQKWSQFATRNFGTGALASAASVGSNLVSGVGLVDAAAQKIGNAISGEYKPVDFNTRAMAPTFMTQGIRGGISQKLTDSYGKIELNEEEHPIASRLFNGKSLGDVYQLGMSMVDSGAVALVGSMTGMGATGTLLLGGAAGSQGMIDALDKGATDTQAISMGIANGVFEALFEYVSIERLINSEPKNMILNFLLQGFTEGSEEVATSIANNIADVMVMMDKSDWMQTMQDYQQQGLTPQEAYKQTFMDTAISIGWDFVGGMITGGLMDTTKQVGSNIVNYAGQQYQNYQTGKAYAQNIGDLMAEAREINPDGSKLMDKIQGRMDTDRSVSALDAAKLVKQNDAGIKRNEVAKLTEAVKGQLAGNADAEVLSRVIAKRVAGEKLSNAEQSLLDASADARGVLAKISPAKVNSTLTPAWAADVDFTAISDSYLTPEITIQTGGMGEAEQKPISFTNALSEASRQQFGNTEQFAQNVSTEAPAAPEPVSNTEQFGNTEQSGETGELEESQPLQETVTPASEEALTKASQKYGDQAGAFKAIYEQGQDLYKYDLGFHRIYEAAKSGVSQSTAVNMVAAQYLSETQRNLAFQTGEAAYNAVKNPAVNKVAVKEWKQGAVRLDQKTLTSAKGFNTQQRKAFRYLQGWTARTGMNVELFQSGFDEEGKITGIYDGKFDRNTGTIYLDVNGGLLHIDDEGQLEKYTMLRTFSHENVHFIRLNNPEGFNTLRKAAFEAMDTELRRRTSGTDIPTTVDDLIRKKQDQYRKATGKAYSYDKASEEVVADALTDILPQSQFLENLYKEDRNVFQMLWDKLKQFISDMKSYFSRLAPNTKLEASLLKQEGKNGTMQYLESIVKMFDEVARESVENYQAGLAVETVKGAPDGVAESNEYTEALVQNTDGEQMQIRTESEAFPKFFRSATTGEATLVKSIPGITPADMIPGLVKGAEVAGYTGRQIREYVMKQAGYDANQISRVNDFMQGMDKLMRDAGVTFKFIDLEDVNNAKLHYTYGSDGKIDSVVLSAMVKNGEYPVNFDLTAICKKKRDMYKVIEKLCKRGSIDSGTLRLTSENIFKINKALKDNGHETACLGCFVEARRYGIQGWVNKICDNWNAIVKMANPDATYFDYGKGASDTLTLEQAAQLEDAVLSFNAANEEKRKNAALDKFRAREAKGVPLMEGQTIVLNKGKKNARTIEHTFNKATFDRLVKSKIPDELKQRYLTCDVSTLNFADVEYLFDNGVIKGGSITNEQTMESLIKSDPMYQRLLRPSDLITANGIANLKKLPNFYSVMYGAYGSGTPKPIQGFTPYNSEIALLSYGKGKNTELAKYLYSIAGVRMQSFSDFQIQNVYDYLQMVGDLAARRLPSHAYTKEISFARLLGMTGIKINLSVMFDVDTTAPDEYAGLTRYDPAVHKGEYARIVLEDENGKWVYNVGDYATQQAYKKAYPDAPLRFLQSIGFADAVKLQTTPGYTRNVGIIAVGLSDKNVLAMLDDNRIRYIIPYHASGLPADVKRASNIEAAVDYSNWQNTTRIDSITDRNGNPVNWSIKEALKRLGNAKAVIQELNDHIQNDGWNVETKKAAAGHGKFALYENLKKTKNPRATADAYIGWAVENGNLPVFYQFANHGNYYKVVYDYNVFDNVAETYAPQEAVTNTYPMQMGDGSVAPSDVTMGGFDSKYFQGLVWKYMETMNRSYEASDPDLDVVVENIENHRYSFDSWKSEEGVGEQLSLRDSEGSTLTPAQQAFFKDSKVRDEDGNLLALYHGTNNSFTKFRQGTAPGWGKGIYFTDNRAATDEFGETKVKAYLNLVNPFDTRTMSYTDIEDAAKKTKAFEKFDRNRFSQSYDGYDSYEDYLSDGLSADIGDIYQEYPDVFNGIIRELGYDGIIADGSNNIDGLEVVAFRPNQVKDVTNQNPTEDEDIRYAIRSSDLSDIDILQQAAAAVKDGDARYAHFTAGEKDALRVFSAHADTLKQAQAQRDALLKQRRSLMQGRKASEIKGDEKAELRKITNNLDTINERIRIARSDLTDIESTKVIRSILQQARKIVEKDAIQRGTEQLYAYAAKRDESAAAKHYREQITKTVKTMSEWLRMNSDKAHVPEVLKKPLNELLQSIDFSSQRYLNGGAMTKADERFGANIAALNALLEGNQAALDGDPNAHDEIGAYLDLSPESRGYIKGLLQAIAVTKGTFTINNMTSEQLKGLSNFLKNVATAVRNVNRTLANARYKNLPDMAHEFMNHANAMGKNKAINNTAAANFVRWQIATPYYAFKRFGPVGSALFDGLAKGWEQFAFDDNAIEEYSRKTFKAEEVKAWEKKVHNIVLEDGSKLKMTTSQIMEFAMLINRPQGLQHIMKGGFRVTGIQQKVGSSEDTTYYHPSMNDIAAITGLLTDRQKEVARKLQNYMAIQGAKWGNEISMARFGYNFYEEGERYYPIHSDKNNLPMSDSDDNSSSMFRLLNMSFSKSLNPHASNAVAIGSIFDTYTDHMSDMAKLHSLGLPLLDCIKWYNYTERTNYEDGTYDKEGVKKAAEQAFGTEAGKYFRTLLKDINGAHEAGDRGNTLASKMISSYKVAAVAANLRVALLQPTSYVRAMAIISPKNLVAAFTSKNAYQEALKYSGTALWKSLGYFDTEVARSMRERIKHAETWKDKVVEKSMTLAEFGDRVTWGRLWVACKLEAKSRNSQLQGEDLKKAAADIFREVVYATQVMDSTLTRSEMMRGKTIWTKLATAFGAEPTLSLNLLGDAVSNLEIDARKSNWRKAFSKHKGKVAMAFTTYICSAAAAAIVESLADAFRDDDDYEEFMEKVQQAFFGETGIYDGNFAQDLTIVGKIPVVKDWVDTLLGKKKDDMSVTALSNLYSAAAIWKETYQLANGTLEKPTSVTWNGHMTDYGKIYKTLQALSQVSGFAVANLTRDAVALWNNTFGYRTDMVVKTYDAGPEKTIKYAYMDGYLSEDEAIDELLAKGVSENQDDAYWKVQSWDTGSSSNLATLKDALAKGEGIEDAISELKEHGYKDDDIPKQIVTTIGSLYKGTDTTPPAIDADRATELLKKYGELDSNEAYWKIQGWDAPKGESYSAYRKVYEAMETGKGFEAAVREMTSHGYDRKKVITQVKSKIGDMYKAGEINKSQALSMLIRYGGLNKDEAEEKVAGWK